MSEWSEERCLLLIDAYREHSVLWNPKDKDYYKKHLKEDAWAIIGGIMNESGIACKQKMINLLATYRRENMKIKKSVGTGKGTDEIYESKWYAFKVLGFLNDRLHLEKDLSLETRINRWRNWGIRTIIMPTPGVLSLSLEPPNKKQKPDPKLQMLKEAFRILKNTANKPQQDIELKSFFDFIQEKMKNFSRDTKNAIQHEIFQIIMRADQSYFNSMQNYDYTTQNQQSPRHSNSSIANTKETPYVDLNRAGPSDLNTAGSSSSSQNTPYSPQSNSSQYSSDMNFKDYV